MSNAVKINACVYTRKGYGREANTGDFYMNGRFMSDQHLDNVQAAVENRGPEYFFGIADNMEVRSDAESEISILKEWARYHEKITVNGGDLDFKMDEWASRSNDAVRLSESIVEINGGKAVEDWQRPSMATLLFTEGYVVAAAAGLSRAYRMRGETFEAMAQDATKKDKLVSMGVITEDEAASVLESTLEALKTPEEEPEEGPVLQAEPEVVEEGDKYLLVSGAVFEALGEDRLEDLLALRSDSNFIAGKIVSEAMKRSSKGDLTAMVVTVEKVYEAAQRRPSMKSRVDALHRAPAVSYKYSKKTPGRFEGLALGTLVVLTLGVVIAIAILIINSIVGGTKAPSAARTPVPMPTVSATATPAETTAVTPEPTTATPSPTPAAEQEYKVKSGDTLNGICKKFYGDTSLVDALAKYNSMKDANSLQLGQVLKIPAAEVLKQP